MRSRRILGAVAALSMAAGMGGLVSTVANAEPATPSHSTTETQSCRASVSGPSEAGTVPRTVDSNGKHYELVWNDEFCGDLDTSKWGLGKKPLNGGMWYADNLGDPNDPSTNIFVKDGALNLRANPKKSTHNGRQYFADSGNVTTEKTAAWKYGRFEIRVRTPGQKGTWPALWMMPKVSPNGWPREGEIDWFENIGTYPNTNFTSIHSSTVPWNTGRSRHDHPESNSVDVPGSGLPGDYHTFAMEWDKGRFDFYLDGKRYGQGFRRWQNRWVRDDGTMYNGDSFGPFNRKFYFIVNLAIGGWAGYTDNSTDWKRPFQVDYIRVYQTKKQQDEQKDATLSLETGGWSAPLAAHNYRAGDKIDSLPTPTSKFGGFAGWYQDPELKTPVTFPYTITDDTMFYAKWRKYRLNTQPASHPRGPVFRDVAANAPFAAHINWLKNAGITTGWPDGTYHPYEAINRDAMAAFLYRLAGRPAYTPWGNPFGDVTPGTQFYKEISWLKSTGITTGYPDGNFGIHGKVNRDAMVAFMYRFCQKYSDKCSADVNPAIYPSFYNDQFKDVVYKNYQGQKTTEFHAEIAWAKAAGITTGWKDGNFRPTWPVNRNAMAAFIYRLKNNRMG